MIASICDRGRSEIEADDDGPTPSGFGDAEKDAMKLDVVSKIDSSA
jgi:hypothetical protein